MTSAFTTTFLGTAVSALGVAFVRGLSSAAGPVKILVQIIRARRNRSGVMSLLEMDDCMLRDIGLTRVDVAAALSSPVTIDPSTRLRVFAVERRAGNRAQAVERMAEARRLTAVEDAARRSMALD